MTSVFSLSSRVFLLKEVLLEWVVAPEESGLPLAAFLFRRLESRYSVRLLKRWIERHACQLNGRTERFASTRIVGGDRVCLRLEEPFSPSTLSTKPSPILYEDEELLAYNKPAWVNSDEQGLLALLTEGRPSLRLVHRLDRETTGVILLAKKAVVFEALVGQFKRFLVHKSYRAIVDGVVKSSRGRIENSLAQKQKVGGQVVWGSVSAHEGAYACTDWRLVRRGTQATLMSCMPRTGRTHQIRVHLAEMGHPILGDFRYGGPFSSAYLPPRLLLHAETIRFRHPVREAELCLCAPLPEDFKKAEEALFLP